MRTTARVADRIDALTSDDARYCHASSSSRHPGALLVPALLYEDDEDVAVVSPGARSFQKDVLRVEPPGVRTKS